MTLALRNISKSFDGFQVIEDVSLSIGMSSLFGLIGPNGAGKSTLFSIMSGFLKADSGSISINDVVLDRPTPQSCTRAGMVRTFQVPREFHHLTVRENMLAASPGHAGEKLRNVFFRPALVRAEEERFAAKADELIGFLNLSKVAELPAGGLSGGQKKLLELGRALMIEPAVVLLDEPFAGVNPVLIEQLIERIVTLNSRGIGFVVVEHDLQALSRLVPNMAVLDRGRILAEGSPQAVLALPEVREAYLGTTA